MTLDETLALARRHLGSGSMESSARLCLADAVAAKDAGDLDGARDWALRSLCYSVGVFHADYVRASGRARQCGNYYDFGIVGA